LTARGKRRADLLAVEDNPLNEKALQRRTMMATILVLRADEYSGTRDAARTWCQNRAQASFRVLWVNGITRQTCASWYGARFTGRWTIGRDLE